MKTSGDCPEIHRLTSEGTHREQVEAAGPSGATVCLAVIVGLAAIWVVRSVAAAWLSPGLAGGLGVGAGGVAAAAAVTLPRRLFSRR